MLFYNVSSILLHYIVISVVTDNNVNPVTISVML